jgi:hypothetical protein
MAVLPTVVSRAFHVPNSTRTPAYWPCSANAGPMHLQCNSSGGLCNRGANRVQPRCKSLNTARAARRLLLLADAEVLEKPLESGD